MRLHVGLPSVASRLSLSGRRDVRFGIQVVQESYDHHYLRGAILRPIEVVHTSTGLVKRVDTSDLELGPRLHRFLFSVRPRHVVYFSM